MADSVRGPTLLDLGDIAQEKMNECLLQCPILSTECPRYYYPTMNPH